VSVIHGNRSQSQRVRSLEGFRAGRFRVLVATDIAARGVDVEGVTDVVNYDVPHEPEAYVHRVGRTARAQRRGEALTLVSREEAGDLARIERLLGYGISRGASALGTASVPLSAPPAPLRLREPRPGGGRSISAHRRRF
jgi:ATP-dependent RNA helicase RhlE